MSKRWLDYIPPALLVVFSAVMWRLLILGPPVSKKVGTGNMDIHIEHLPVVSYGFDAMSRGDFPLWNPNQLAGMPFFAVPHTALLYPLNFFYWILEPAVAIEATAILHLAVAGICTYLLCMRLGMHRLGALFAGAVLVSSGTWMGLAAQPTLHSALVWLPATVLAIEFTLAGHRLGPFALALCMASQALLGASELFLYNSYGAILYGAVRSVSLWKEQAGREIATRIAISIAAAALGIGIAAVQLVPSLELVSLSDRSEGSVSLEQAKFLHSSIPDLLRDLFVVQRQSAIGLVAWVGLLAGFSGGRRRTAWSAAMVIAALGVTMSLGGLLYELHYHSGIGAMFRRTQKWMILYSFGAAMLGGLGITRLLDSLKTSERDPRIAAIAASILVAAGVLYASEESFALALVSGALLAAFALVPQRYARVLLLVALCAADLIALGAQGKAGFLRPYHDRGLIHRAAGLWNALEPATSQHRVFVSRSFVSEPDFTPKQGTLRGVPVVTDYEPLALARYANYFRLATGDKRTVPFAGFTRVTESAKLRLLDLAATRFYVVWRGKEESIVARKATRWRKGRGRQPPILERAAARPRTWVATQPRYASDEKDALKQLATPRFVMHRDVVLEEVETEYPAPKSKRRVESSAVFETDEAERVVIRAQTDTAGWLVLADVHYPGWRAEVNGEEVPIARANSLFRAVRIEEGETVVTFEYRPQSLVTGLQISAVSGAALLLLSIFGARCSAVRRAASGTTSSVSAAA
jgi:hypothetical protein